MEKVTMKFNKDQIIGSNKFKTIEKDILKVVLEDKQYSLEEVNKILNKFRNEEVR